MVFFRGFNGLYHLLISLKDLPLPPNSRNTDSSDHGVVSRDNQYRIFDFCKCITKGKYSLGYNMRKTRGSIFLDALFQLIRFKYQHSDQRELSVQLTTFNYIYTSFDIKVWDNKEMVTEQLMKILSSCHVKYKMVWKDWVSWILQLHWVFRCLVNLTKSDFIDGIVYLFYQVYRCCLHVFGLSSNVLDNA